MWCSIVATVLSVLSRFIFMLSGAGSLPPILYNDRSNEQVLKKLSQEFETRSVKRLTPLDDICFTCLRYKAPHDEHCKDCNACVVGFHFHSKTLGKCVGQQNQRSYGIYQFASFITFTASLIQIIFFSRIHGGYHEKHSSNWFFSVIELHYKAAITFNWHLLLPLLVAWMGTLGYADSLLTLTVAAGKKITINELAQPWKYRHNLELMQKKEKKECKSRGCSHAHGGEPPFLAAHQKKKLRHKHVGLCRCLFNILGFYLCCRRGKYQVQLPEKKAPSYIELQELESSHRRATKDTERTNEEEEDEEI